MLASHLPKIVMHEPKIKGKKNQYTIEIEMENEGFLPTALKQAMLVKMVRPDRITLEFPKGMLPERRRRGRGRDSSSEEEEEPKEKSKVEILEPEDKNPFIDIGRIEGNKKKKTKFKIQLNGIEQVECTIKFTSTRGGVISNKIVIGGQQ